MNKTLFIIALFIFNIGLSQVPNANDLVAIHAATLAEINAIVSPIEGSLIYNRDDKFLYQYTDSSWQKLTPEGNETKIISDGNVTISGTGTTADPYIVSSIKPTFTDNNDGSFTFSNGTDPDISFTPNIPGNLPIVSSTNGGTGNCIQFTQNETRDLLIRGNYFDGESTVTITGQTINSVTIDSDTRITANITSGSTFGDYDVTVTNNSGAGTLISGFQLQPQVPLTTSTITQTEMSLTPSGMTYNGNTLTKTGAYGWNTEGYSLNHAINEDNGGRLNFTLDQTNKRMMVGLSYQPAYNASYTSIDFAMYILTNSQIQIRERGVSKGYHSAYVTGDVLSIDVDCIGYVTYLRNGVVFYTSTILATDPLFFDSSFLDTAGKISNISMTY